MEEWKQGDKHRDQPFFVDGVIDPELWNKMPIRLMFLNKEAHDSNTPDSRGFNLVEIIRDEWKGIPKGTTNLNMACWSYAIQKAFGAGAEGLPDWQEVSADANADVANAFLSVAVANIKKSGGRTQSNHDDLQEYANSDADLIRRQVDLIQPDILIAGHVWYLVKNRWEDCEELHECVFRHNQTIIIDFWHPANRAARQMKYYALDSLLRASEAFAKIRGWKGLELV
jgi:hypothetical protein